MWQRGFSRYCKNVHNYLIFSCFLMLQPWNLWYFFVTDQHMAGHDCKVEEWLMVNKNLKIVDCIFLEYQLLWPMDSGKYKIFMRIFTFPKYTTTAIVKIKAYVRMTQSKSRHKVYHKNLWKHLKIAPSPVWLSLGYFEQKNGDKINSLKFKVLKRHSLIDVIQTAHSLDTHSKCHLTKFVYF